MQNPLTKQRALMALREQAARWIAAYKADLTASGSGFTADDVAVLEAAVTTYPPPKPESITWRQRLGMLKVGIAASWRSYPAGGLDEKDPALAPIGGMSFAAYAVAAAALGWGSDDEALVARVTGALGHTPADWKVAMDGWTERITDDVVIATMYGQLFSQVGDLPRHP